MAAFQPIIGRLVFTLFESKLVSNLKHHEILGQLNGTGKVDATLPYPVIVGDVYGVKMRRNQAFYRRLGGDETGKARRKMAFDLACVKRGAVQNQKIGFLCKIDDAPVIITIS